MTSDMFLNEEEADAADDDQQQQEQQLNAVASNSLMSNPTVTSIVEEEGTLRHRRTNSKDLNNQTRTSEEVKTDDLIRIDGGDKSDEML